MTVSVKAARVTVDYSEMFRKALPFVANAVSNTMNVLINDGMQSDYGGNFDQIAGLINGRSVSFNIRRVCFDQDLLTEVLLDSDYPFEEGTAFVLVWVRDLRHPQALQYIAAGVDLDPELPLGALLSV